MKKSLLTAILLLATSAFVKAQDYIPLIDNTVWSVRVYYFTGSQDLFYGPGIDEAINGQTYRKVSNVPMTAGGEVFIREDVAQRKVYRLKNSQEELLYDFTLQENDVITLNNQPYTVVSRDSVAVMTGRKRVKIHLVHYAGTMAMGSETWIEGVGNPQVPLKPNYELLSDPAYSLICTNTNGNPVYNNGLVNTGTPVTCPQSTMDTDEFTVSRIQVWPNPVRSNMVISSSEGFSNATLTMHNNIGQQVAEITNINGHEYIFNRDNLASGLYFIMISQNGKESFTEKILVSD
jgi:hypothetical protein